MRVRALLTGAALAALLAPLAPAAAAAPDLADLVGPAPAGRGTGPLSAPALVPGQLLVTTRTPGEAGALRRADRAVEALAARVVRVRTAPGKEAERARELRRRPGVVAVERVAYRTPLRTPDDPLFAEQWAHSLTDVERAWDVTTGSSAVRVAVIDSGVDARHVDLGNVVEQVDLSSGELVQRPVGSDNRGCDGDDHGTHVAGIVGADGDDGVGVAGAAWRVGIVDVGVFYDEGRGCLTDDATVLSALSYAVSSGVDVVNLSLGADSSACSTAYTAALQEARSAGVLVVSASGNSATSSSPGPTGVPASCDGVLSVGAVDRSGERASYSTFNRFVDLVAPGGDSTTGFADGILSTVGDDQHDWIEGTSMATPYVSGVAALLRAADPAITVDQMEAVLEGTADGGGVRTDETGWGLVDAGEALERTSLRDYPPLQPDPAFPVGDDDGGEFEPPPPSEAEVFRIDTGSPTTSAVPQAVALSQTTFDDDGAAYGVLARVDDFADALSGSSLGLGVGPLLFTGRTGALPAPTRDELLRTLLPGSAVYLLGGPAALPTTLEPELRGLGFEPVRLQGQTREATAVAVAAELDRVRADFGLEPAQVYLLARSNDWADAVAGGSLGAFYGLPVLLTPTATLAPATRDRLAAARPAVVVPLGGTAALSDATVAAAGSAAGGAQVERLAGADRYGTAVQIASLFESLLAEEGVAPRCVLAVNLVRPDGFTHVLAATTVAGAYGCVMVPVTGPTGDGLPTTARDYVRGFGIDGLLVGGTDLVSERSGSELLTLLRSGA